VLSLAANAAGAATAAPERLGLAAAVERALQRNPSVVVAREEIERARALLVETRSQSLPSLTGYGSYTRVEATRGLPGSVVPYGDGLGASLVASVPLVSPQRWAAWAHAEDDIRVASFAAVDAN